MASPLKSREPPARRIGPRCTGELSNPTVVPTPGLAERTTRSPSAMATEHDTHERDQALVARVQRGDTVAFDLLVRKYQHRVAALISRYIHDWAEVQDVAQDTFIRAY